MKKIIYVLNGILFSYNLIKLFILKIPGAYKLTQNCEGYFLKNSNFNVISIYYVYKLILTIFG
jgi:hypothetical protein